MFAPIIQRKDILNDFFSKGTNSDGRIKYLLFHTGEDVFIQNNILQMFEDQENADEYTNQFLIGTLTRDFAYVLRKYLGTLETSKSNKIVVPDNFLVMNFIQENLIDVTLADVAKKFNFSMSYCSRLIKSSTGLNFNDWKRILRLRRAEYFLMNTNKTVNEISDALGYVNTETFIRAFRKEFHLTPTTYRKQFRNKI